MYIGRAKVSLRNIIEQTSNYLTLPLISDNAAHNSTGAVLIVNVYPVDAKVWYHLGVATVSDFLYEHDWPPHHVPSGLQHS